MMRRWTGIGLRAALAAVLLLPGGLPAQTAGTTEGAEAAVVWLVRHAERADDGMDPQPDPELSAAGHERARALARLLSDAGIDRVWSTPFQRTRQTAAPLAEALGLEVGSYDPRDAEGMEAFLREIRSLGRHLVVGHSNTTPALVDRLGGDPISPIEEMEYDRIYVVTLGPDGTVTSTLLRFGAEAPGG